MKDKCVSLETFNIKNNVSKSVDIQNEIHQVHNYIRDYTKISDEDKPFFIAIILISIKKSSFEHIFNEYKNKKYIYDVLMYNLNDYDIDIGVFSFLRKDENNQHLYNLIRMIYSIYDKNPNIDILNEFYNEFVRYNNRDSKKLGIVLTPPHIVQLMTKLLDINNNDIILDLCTGTGSFLIECHQKHPKKLIGCEYQNKLFNLLKCNMIIRDIDNCEIIKGNCFEQKFKATKSIINPPYSIKSEPEYEFILKQLDSVCDNGIITAIIPISKISNNSLNNRYKKRLLSSYNITSIIICRKTLFYPNAFIQCCILTIEKTNYKKRTKIIDYTDDGFDLIKHNGLIKNNTYQTKLDKVLSMNYPEIELVHDANWNILSCNEEDICIDFKKINLKKIELEYLKKKDNIIHSNNTKSKDIKFKSILITDLFTIEPKKIRFIKDCKDNKIGKYHLISSTKLNNGIVQNIDFYDYNEHCLTLSDLGEDISCFYQFKKFCITNHIFVLRCKEDIDEDEYIMYAEIIESSLRRQYKHFRNITLTLLKKTIINIPEN